MSKFKLNPDTEKVNTIKDALKQNDGYCPCRINKTEDTKCMCKEFRDQLNDDSFTGECHCGLFVKE